MNGSKAWSRQRRSESLDNTHRSYHNSNNDNDAEDNTTAHPSTAPPLWFLHRLQVFDTSLYIFRTARHLYKECKFSWVASYTGHAHDGRAFAHKQEIWYNLWYFLVQLCVCGQDNHCPETADRQPEKRENQTREERTEEGKTHRIYVICSCHMAPAYTNKKTLCMVAAERKQYHGVKMQWTRECGMPIYQASGHILYGHCLA